MYGWDILLITNLVPSSVNLQIFVTGSPEITLALQRNPEDFTTS